MKKHIILMDRLNEREVLKTVILVFLMEQTGIGMKMVYLRGREVSKMVLLTAGIVNGMKMVYLLLKYTTRKACLMVSASNGIKPAN